MNKGLKAALEIINEVPSFPTRPIIYFDAMDNHKKMKMPDGSTFCITCSEIH